jgi:hypothetical protein
MQDQSRQRETRMMNAVAGLGGRSALSSEVDLRLGLVPAAGGLPGWIGGLAGWMIRRVSLWHVAPVGSAGAPAQTSVRTVRT